MLFLNKINLDISGFTSIFNHSYKESKNSIGGSYRKLSNLEKFGQLVKAISLFSLGILSLGTLFISATVRTNIQTWWDECKTGKRKIEIIKDVKTQHASIRKADNVSKKTFKKSEKIPVALPKLPSKTSTGKKISNQNSKKMDLSKQNAAKSKNIEKSSLADLPHDALILLFKNLDSKDWESLSQTNKKLHVLSHVPKVLEHLLEIGAVPQDKLFQFMRTEGQYLTTLDLPNKHYKLSEQELIEIFKSCPNLKNLNLSFRYLTDLAWKSLPQSLESLDLSNCMGFTDASFAHVKELKALQSLNLTGCDSITDNQLAHLKELKTLKSLNLSGCIEITDAGLTNLKELDALQFLNLSWCKRITNAGIAHVKELKTLLSLDLSGCKEITDVGLAYLKEFTALQSLNLSECKGIKDAWLAHLKDLKTLQSLNLSGCKEITDEGLAYLTELKALQSLVLSNCWEITDEGLAYLTELKALQSLVLNNCWEITEEGLACLTELKALQSLDLRWCREINDVGLEHVKELKALRSLDLRYCDKITNAGIKNFQESRNSLYPFIQR